MIKITKPREFGLASFNFVSGASPNPSAWTQIDMSAIVGNRRALCYLSVACTGGSAAYAFREGNLAADARPQNFPLDCGGCHSVNVKQDGYGYVMIMTNYDGQIDYFCSVAARETYIMLNGFIA